MLYQESNNPLMPRELNFAQFFAQSSIALRRKFDERMISNERLFPSPILHGVSAKLTNQTLWQEFNERSTEMIITKCGRRMFPSIQINVNGLQKRENYFVLLEVTPASDRRHKYCGYDSESKNGNGMGCWSYAGPAEPQHPFNRRIYVHPDSPAMGSHWMDNSINFLKLKLTNNINDTNNNIVLTSMHKYVPKIWIIQCGSAKNYNELFSYPATSFIFKETEFIAVTAYQNDHITKLKIDYNPFAKGFREAGQSRSKRKYHQIDHQRKRIESDSSRDEGVSVSFSDSDSNQVASEEGSVASNSENQESPKRESLTAEREDNNTNNDAHDDARSLIAEALIPIAANPRSPVKVENDQVTFHRPWVDPPRRQETPAPHRLMIAPMPIRESHYSPYQPYHQYMEAYSQYMQNQMRCYSYHDCPYQPLWL